MKTLSFALFSLSLLLATGCAQKRYSTNFPTGPLSQREVDERRSNIAVSNVEQQEKWKDQLELRCPGANDDDRRNVIIEPALGRYAYLVKGNGFQGVFAARYAGVVNAVNTTNATPDILEGGTALVRNMCPQGRITLVTALPYTAGMFVGAGYNTSPTNQNYFWTAEFSILDRHYIAESQPLSLYVYSWQSRTKMTWEIRLRRIDQQ